MTVHILIPTTPERRDRLRKCTDSIHANAGWSHIISTYENQNEGYIEPCRRLLLDLKPDTVVWCLGDDVILTQSGTLLLLMEEFADADRVGDHEDIVVQPDDGFNHGYPLATMPLCRASTMLKFGLYPGFFLNFADVVFTELVLRNGKLIYCPDIHVEHQHFANGKAPWDETYQAAKDKFKQDEATYTRVMAELGLTRTKTP